MGSEETGCASWYLDRTDCPIPSTHRRLGELHHFWHQAQRSYHEPSVFRTNLNAAIQAARNVTFALQSEQSGICDFQSWYDGQRDVLKQDPIMKWLHGARNLIVKKGDLEVHSIARVSLKNWLEHDLGAIDVPPFLAAERIVEYIGNRKDFPLPAGHEESVLCVERSWVVRDLPTHELLEALAAGLETLLDLVGEAHQRAIAGPGSCSRGSYVELGRRPACMRASGATRTAYLHVSRQERLDLKLEPERVDPRVAEKVVQRYSIEPGSAPRIVGSEGVFRYAEWVFEVGKRMLERDGTHAAIAFLVLPSGSVKLISCNVPDQESKYVAYRMIADEVDKLGATAVLFANEIWWAPVAEAGGKRAGLVASRREAFMVSAATEEGQERNYIASFTRKPDGGVELGESEVAGPMNSMYLGPIREVWARRRPHQATNSKEPGEDRRA